MRVEAQKRRSDQERLERPGRLCQHVPETAATQSRPAGGQARVRCVVSSPVLHHVHCVFGSLPVHGRRCGSPLPAILWLCRVALVRRLPRPGVRTPGRHLSSRVVGVAGVGLCHVDRLGVALGRVALRRVALSRVARSRGVVRRGLVRAHLGRQQSPSNQWGEVNSGWREDKTSLVSRNC